MTRAFAAELAINAGAIVATAGPPLQSVEVYTLTHKALVAFARLVELKTIEAAKRGCVTAWDTTNDPPCHPADRGWRPCVECAFDEDSYQQGLQAAHAGFLQVWDEALHGDMPKPGQLGDPTLERLFRLTEQLRADAGLGNMGHKMLAEECEDSDALLRALGLDPEDCRTDGGRLNLPRIRERLGK